MQLAGKVAIVTGASDGLGKATADLLLQEGCKVVRIGLAADGYEEKQTENELNIIGDLTDEQTRGNLFTWALAAFDTVDILVNNAAVSIYAPSYETTHNEMQKIYDICGQVTVPWATAYCASKFALHGLTQGLRREVKKTGIHVMLVMPAIIDTNIRLHVLRGTPPGNVNGMKGCPPNQIARAIIRAMKRNANNLYTPFYLAYPFMKMQEYTPWLMDWYLDTKR